MNIAILGGSFDPPHLGHIFIAQQVKEFIPVDQIWLMPVYQHAFDKKLTAVQHRLAMTRYLENEYTKVSPWEIDQQKTSYTIDTLNAIQKRFLQNKFFWILGSDQLPVFHKYKQWQEIIKKHSLLIFPREYILPHLEEEVKQSLRLQTIPENVIVLQNQNLMLTNISSTKIRQRIKNGLSITNFVPKDIEKYISENRLYL